MSLELFESKKGRAGKHLLYIDDTQYRELKGAFALYGSKSGIKIDEYTDTELTSDIAVLIESIHEAMASSNMDLQIYKELLCALKTAESEGKSIVFLGGGFC